MGSMWIGNSHYSYVFSFRGSLGAAYRPLNLVTTDSLAGKAGTAPIKTGGEMRKTHVNTGFHDHAESMGRLRRLRKSRYSLNNPETWARSDAAVKTAKEERRKWAIARTPANRTYMHGSAVFLMAVAAPGISGGRIGRSLRRRSRLHGE